MEEKPEGAPLGFISSATNFDMPEQEKVANPNRPWAVDTPGNKWFSLPEHKEGPDPFSAQMAQAQPAEALSVAAQAAEAPELGPPAAVPFANNQDVPLVPPAGDKAELDQISDPSEDMMSALDDLKDWRKQPHVTREDNKHATQNIAKLGHAMDFLRRKAAR